MRLKVVVVFLLALLVASPAQADCEVMVGERVQISDEIEVAEIMDSGPNQGQAVYTFSGTTNNLSCGGNAMFLYDRSGQLQCRPGQRVSAEGILVLNYVFAVFTDSVSCN